MPVAGQISNELERCVVELLQAQPDAMISISDLQAALDTRLAERAPGPVTLMTGIERRPDLFLVLEHVEHLPGAETWPRELRSTYDTAFSSAGLAAETHIALERSASEPSLPAVAGTDILRVLQHSVLRLWRVREKRQTPGLSGAVELIDTVRTALHSNSDTE